MSDGAIISRDYIRSKARAAFERGDSRDSHNMNHGAAALTTWLHEFDRLSASFAAASTHHASSTKQRFDAAQGATV